MDYLGPAAEFNNSWTTLLLFDTWRDVKSGTKNRRHGLVGRLPASLRPRPQHAPLPGKIGRVEEARKGALLELAAELLEQVEEPGHGVVRDVAFDESLRDVVQVERHEVGVERWLPENDCLENSLTFKSLFDVCRKLISLAYTR